MGNCPFKHSPKVKALVMTETGKLIDCKKRVTGKEVLAAHPGSKLVKYGSEGSVLPESGELEPGKLYFLMREKLAGSGDVYEKFTQIAESMGYPGVKAEMKENIPASGSNSGMINGQVVLGHGQLFMFEALELKKASPWRPGLQTIPESVSPRLGIYVIESSPATLSGAEDR